MNKKLLFLSKILLGIIILLCSIVGVFAGVDIAFIDTFETSSSANYSTSWTGFSSTYKMEGTQSAQFTGTGDGTILIYEDINSLNYTYNLSISVWIRTGAAGYTYPTLMILQDSNNYVRYSGGGDSLRGGIDVKNGGAWTYNLGTNASCTPISTNAWYNFSLTINRVGDTDYVSVIVMDSSSNPICSHGVSTNYSFLDATPTMYAGVSNGNGGSSTYYYDYFVFKGYEADPPPPETNFTIITNDFYSGASINNFTASLTYMDIFNSPTTQYYTTTNGLITTEWSNGSYLYDTPVNITIYDVEDNGGYFAKTYFNYNLSGQLASTVYQVEANFLSYEDYTNDSLSGVNFYIGSNLLTEPAFLSRGTYNIIAEKAGYYNKTQAITYAALDNITSSFTLFDTKLIVNASNAVNNATILIFSVRVENEDIGVNETIATTNGTITFNLLKEYNYTAYFMSSFFASNATTIYINSTESTKRYTFRPYEFNSLEIFIYNGTTSNLLTQLVTMSAISNLTSYVNTSTTGIIRNAFLFPNVYELRFNSSGYNTVSKFINILNDSSNTVTVYMLSNESSELQTVQVVDTSNQPVEGAIVWLQKQVIENPALYLTVQEAITDFDGKTTVWVIRDTSIKYRFAVIYNGVALRIQPNNNLFTTETSFIPGVTETIQLVVETETAGDINALEHNNVQTNMTFGSTDNNTVYFTWIDGNNAAEGGLLTIEAKYNDNTSLTFEMIAQVSLNGTSGTVNYTLIPLNGTLYRLKGFVLFAGQPYLYEERLKNYGADVATDKNTGIFVAAIVLMVVALLTVKFGALVSSIMTFASMFLLTALHIVDIPVSIISTIIALGLILFIKSRGRNE